jgi:hypothetical protein
LQHNLEPIAPRGERRLTVGIGHDLGTGNLLERRRRVLRESATPSLQPLRFEAFARRERAQRQAGLLLRGKRLLGVVYRPATVSKIGR